MLSSLLKVKAQVVLHVASLLMRAVTLACSDHCQQWTCGLKMVQLLISYTAVMLCFPIICNDSHAIDCVFQASNSMLYVVRWLIIRVFTVNAMLLNLCICGHALCSLPSQLHRQIVSLSILHDIHSRFKFDLAVLCP